MNSERLEFGDRVRHLKRPEWGVGSVVRAEDVALNGHPSQRVSVRFPNVGLKVLNTAQAELEKTSENDASPPDHDRPNVAEWDRVRQSEWLSSHAEKKIEELMLRLPPAVRDPFVDASERLKRTLDLYRFDKSGHGLIDWAVAQSGLDDPLTRFNRQELETMFDRWSVERSAQLARVLEENRGRPETVERLLAAAPKAARNAVRGISTAR